MTPADHGYRRCGWCGVWRAPGTLDDTDSCLDRTPCALAMSGALKAPAIRAAWVPRALDWHTDACLTRQATGEGCNCRPWTEGAP